MLPDGKSMVFTMNGVDIPDPFPVSATVATGPVGPAGPIGPIGPAGPIGPQGVAGTGDPAATIAAAPTITTVADADGFSVSSAGALKKLSWANLKAAIKAWWADEPATLKNKKLIDPNIHGIYPEGTIAANFRTVAGAVDYLAFSGSANGFPTISCVGASPNVGLTVAMQGDGKFTLFEPAGKSATFAVSGPDANVDLNIAPKGTGQVKIGGNAVVTTVAAQALSNKTLHLPTMDAVIFQDTTTPAKKATVVPWALTAPRTLRLPDTDGALVGRPLNTPASATAPGSPGDVCFDQDYFYVCFAVNKWKRAPITTW
jgi:hypothetical protein